MLRNRISQIVATLALAMFAVNVWAWYGMWTGGEMSGAFESETVRRHFVEGFVQAAIDPLFLFTSAVMIEYLARGVRYLEAIGIILKNQVKAQDDE